MLLDSILDAGNFNSELNRKEILGIYILVGSRQNKSIRSVLYILQW